MKADQIAMEMNPVAWLRHWIENIFVKIIFHHRGVPPRAAFDCCSGSCVYLCIIYIVCVCGWIYLCDRDNQCETFIRIDLKWRSISRHDWGWYCCRRIWQSHRYSKDLMDNLPGIPHPLDRKMNYIYIYICSRMMLTRWILRSVGWISGNIVVTSVHSTSATSDKP